MNFFPHIPMLSTVFSSIGCYLLPFGVVLLWLLYESRKVKAILLAGAGDSEHGVHVFS